ncbi:hypothetical protein H0H92_014079 [Tricholoma furcatifolium]|nr:hypothetical protein H0H92_014079 [Tricholoma furcatifolium]
MLSIHAIVLVAFAFAWTKPSVAWTSYSIQDTYQGYDFFDLDDWTWETENDPTHGRVNFVDLPTAQAANLTYATSDKFVMRVDSSSMVPPSARGRNSVRIHSSKAYADSVIVLDLQHMPTGCATWPAFWTLSQAGPWPNGGEIDIIEGFRGVVISPDCNTKVNSNQGCGTSFTETTSYGAGFNDADGGWYVLERNKAKGINVWFWSRDDPFVPIEVQYGFPELVPDFSWGIPNAQFPTGHLCNYASHFDAHEMIFDITLCVSAPSSTVDLRAIGLALFIRRQGVEAVPAPIAFKEAYWEVNSLRVYTPDSDSGITIDVNLSAGL